MNQELPHPERKERRPPRRTLPSATRWLLIAMSLASLTTGLHASRKDRKEKENLAQYIARVDSQGAVPSTTLGSVWLDAGRMASLSSDYKASAVGDLITIVVAHSLTSTNTGDVSTARTYSASSGINTLPGKLKTGGIASLLGLQSAETLAGKAQGDTTSSLNTTLAGRVVAVLSGGNLVIEASRVINMNNEKQTVTVRGLVRRGDIGPSNMVASNAIGDLELEIKGKGVISNGVRPPNRVLRAIMRILNF